MWTDPYTTVSRDNATQLFVLRSSFDEYPRMGVLRKLGPSGCEVSLSWLRCRYPALIGRRDPEESCILSMSCCLAEASCPAATATVRPQELPKDSVRDAGTLAGNHHSCISTSPGTPAFVAEIMDWTAWISHGFWHNKRGGSLIATHHGSHHWLWQ